MGTVADPGAAAAGAVAAKLAAGKGPALVGLGAGELLGATLAELTAKATATQATDTPPMIHGRRSLCLSIG